jgi:4-hydroxybenzoate polyprenyltransferase
VTQGASAVDLVRRRPPAIALRRVRAAAVFDLSRGRQALLSVAQPALAAVLALGGMPSLRTTVVGLVAATAGFLSVFSLNDVLDRKVDARSLRAGKDRHEGYDIDTAFERHPLARGDLSLRFSLAWVIVLALIAALGALLLSPLCLALFAGAVALEIVYCALRSVTWTKTVVSGVMVGLGGLAGWAAVAPLSSQAVSVFVFLALWEIGGRNIANDLSDVDSDASVGIRTVATTFGYEAAALAAAAVGIATVAWLPALGLSVGALVAALVLGVWSVIRPAWLLVLTPTSAQAGSYFNRASLFPVLVLLAELAAMAAAGR